MVAIPFPAGTYPGTRPQESAGRLINAVSEPLGDGGQKLIRAPGLTSFATYNPLFSLLDPTQAYRGAIERLGVLFVAYKNSIAMINAAGVVTQVPGSAPTFPGSDKVTFAKNNHVTGGSLDPQILAVSDAGTFEVTASAITELVSVPAVFNSICFGDGYFFGTTAAGQVFASGLNATTWNALDVAQANASADALVRGVFYERELFLMGEETIEAWSNTGNPTGFPFSRSAIIRHGLLNKSAVTGMENGWGGQLYWVANDSSVRRLEGYAAQRVSTPDLERLLAAADPAEIECWNAVSGGHAYVFVGTPDWTWAFDTTTSQWHERQSYERLHWRATGPSINVFDRWFMGDRYSGSLLELTEASPTELGQPLIFHVESAQGKGFPTPMRVDSAHFDFVTGVGNEQGQDPIETDPRIDIYWSDDGGATWSHPLVRHLGRQGRTGQRASVFRTGRTTPKGRRWRLRVADPVYVSLLGGDMQVRASKS